MTAFTTEIRPALATRCDARDHHHLRAHRLDPHAVDVALSADHRRPDRRAGIEAAEAGAAILHLHARDPETGRPSADPAHFRAFLPRLKAGCDAVLNLSTGGSAVMSLDDRLAAAKDAAPEMASLNMGTMNFALYPMADRITDWQHDWEKPFLEGSDDLVFRNTPRDIARILTELGQERGARFEFECYDLSHLTCCAISRIAA